MALNKKYTQHVKTVVKQYNDRRRYYLKKGKDVPPATSYSQLMAYYGQNKMALNRRLKQLEAYNYENAKQDLRVGKYRAKVNKYDYDVFQQNYGLAHGALEEKLRLSKLRDQRDGYGLPSERTGELMARLKTLERGKKHSATTGDIKAAMSQARYYTENRIKTDEQFYQNFMQMYKEQMQLVKVPKRTQDKIENNFRKLTPDELLEMVESDPSIRNVLEWYKITKATKGRNLTALDIDPNKSTFENLQPYIRGEKQTESTYERERFKELADYLPHAVKKYQTEKYDKPDTTLLKQFRRYLRW